jgi:holo-[acyl-carrier protein] synthase
MKIFLGTDICDIARIEKAYKRFGEKFLNRTFSQAEIKYALNSSKKTAERLAVRFATKEAVSKALKAGINKIGWNKGINWKDVELVNGEYGEAFLSLRGKALQLAQKFEISRWEVSVSHSESHAISTVIGYNEK